MAIFLIVTPLLGQETHQNVTKPLAKAEVLSLLSGGVPVDRVTSIVKERGVDFVPGDDYLKQVRANGGDDALIAALRDAFKIAQVDCAEYEEWHGQYQWGDGCRLWNELIRSNNKSVIANLKASPESYVMFPRPNVFTMVLFGRGPTRFFFGRYTSEGGEQPAGIEMDREMTECSTHDDATLLWRSDGKINGIREIVLTPDELMYSVDRYGALPYKETISRSTGRYRHVFLPPSQGSTPHYSKAAVYHFALLQE